MVHIESVVFSFLFLAFASTTTCTHYQALIGGERVWSGGRVVHTESVTFSFLLCFSLPLLAVHTNQPYTLACNTLVF